MDGQLQRSVILSDLSGLTGELDLSLFSSIIILVDENTKANCLPKLVDAVPLLSQALVLVIPSGEQYKTISTCEKVWSQLAENHIDRKALFINLGGGVICDMGGFIAATYKRGISFIHIPTTLLAQADAAIGGKLAIDLNSIKNSIGLFQYPELVVNHPAFLDTLDQRQLFSGFAELLKHGLIADKLLWEELLSLHPIGLVDKPEILQKGIAIKQNIVLEDPKEKGRRQLLNFGHTIGHALETYSLLHWQKPLLHGEAIVLGMMAESFLSTLYSGMSEEEMSTILYSLNMIYDHVELEEWDDDALITIMLKDKKNTNKAINFALLESIGNGVYNKTPDMDDIYEALSFLKQLA